MIKSVTVVGASSALAISSIKYLSELGYSVVSVSSKFFPDEQNYFTFSNPRLSETAEASDFWIYFSWSSKRDYNSQRESFIAASLLSNRAQYLGKNFIFISSLAGKPLYPTSNYGHFKKLVDKVVALNSQVSLRPATVVFHETDFGVSSALLRKWTKYLAFSKYLFKPIVLPTVTIQTFLSVLLLTLEKAHTPGVTEAQDGEWRMGASQAGAIRLNWGALRPLIKLLPISISDRLRTVLDINGYVGKRRG